MQEKRGAGHSPSSCHRGPSGTSPQQQPARPMSMGTRCEPTLLWLACLCRAGVLTVPFEVDSPCRPGHATQDHVKNAGGAGAPPAETADPRALAARLESPPQIPGLIHGSQLTVFHQTRHLPSTFKVHSAGPYRALLDLCLPQLTGPVSGGSLPSSGCVN